LALRGSVFWHLGASRSQKQRRAGSGHEISVLELLGAQSAAGLVLKIDKCQRLLVMASRTMSRVSKDVLQWLSRRLPP
jgi:hypothetical protein